MLEHGLLQLSRGVVAEPTLDEYHRHRVFNSVFRVQAPQSARRIAIRRQTATFVGDVPAICYGDFLTNFFMRRVYFSSDSEDRALVRQALAGQADAFGVLVSRYQKVMYTVALRMLGN